MNTPRFEGTFKWSTVRAGLLSLREDVQSIKKVAGRNVTIDEHRSKGKVINVASRRPTGGGGGICPEPCPGAITVQFNNVIFDGCCLSAPTSSSIVTDIGLFNDLDVVLNTDAIGDCCLYDYSDDSTMAVHAQIWTTSTDCSGTPLADRDFHLGDSLFVAVGCLGGTWYIAAGLSGDLLFYATTTSISSPVANELTSCDGTIVPRDFMNADCSLSSQDTQSAGYSGTATITLP